MGVQQLASNAEISFEIVYSILSTFLGTEGWIKVLFYIILQYLFINMKEYCMPYVLVYCGV